VQTMATAIMTKLARALAHPDLEVRQKGLEVVRSYFKKAAVGLAQDDLMKLWKGECVSGTWDHVTTTHTMLNTPKTQKT
jgi:hypothetical protein